MSHHISRLHHTNASTSSYPAASVASKRSPCWLRTSPMRRRRAAGRVGCERKNSWPGKLFGHIKVRLGMSLHEITLAPFTIRLSDYQVTIHICPPQTSSLRPRPAVGLHRCAQHRRGKPPQSVATSPTLQIWTRVGSLGVLGSSMMFNEDLAKSWDTLILNLDAAGFQVWSIRRPRRRFPGWWWHGAMATRCQSCYRPPGQDLIAVVKAAMCQCVCGHKWGQVAKKV